MDFSKLYINGEWVTPNTEEYIEVENPADRSIIDRVPRSNEEDVNMAINAASEAFELWQYTDLDYRIGLMEKFIGNLESYVEDMADIVVKELGAPYEFAKNTHIVTYIEDAKNYIKVARDYEFEKEFPGYIVRREAFGVVAALTPWNYPFGQITKKIVPALLAGNTIVLKPSQQTPLVAYYLTQAIDRAGFPKGVFNLVTGRGSEVGNIISTHKKVDLVSFTGSTSGGIEVGKLALDDVKAMALELGGKSASILLEDADLDLAFNIIFNSIFLNTGQSCSALSRLLVPREDKEKVEAYILENISRMTYGDPRDSKNKIGPLASSKQFTKVRDYISLGIEEGAELLYGNLPKDFEEGYYIGPTVFTEVKNSMRIAQEEIFGPVLSIIYYDNLEEAIDLANDSDYGLFGAVFGGQLLAEKVARKMKTGTVIINNGVRTHAAPFGGYKHSGIGREGGVYGLEEYLEVKAIFS